MITATFSMVWQVYGKQTIELPDYIDVEDKEAVRQYIEDIWRDIPLPVDGDYLDESDQFDELISIDEAESPQDNVKVLYDIDPETPVSIQGPVVRADWYDAGEGFCGDYDPQDPDDVPLLRFDIYIRYGDQWEPVEDASYCTLMPATADREVLTANLRVIYDEYNDVLSTDPEASVKKLGERLSFVGRDC